MNEDMIIHSDHCKLYTKPVSFNKNQSLGLKKHPPTGLSGKSKMTEVLYRTFNIKNAKNCSCAPGWWYINSRYYPVPKTSALHH